MELWMYPMKKLIFTRQTRIHTNVIHPTEQLTECLSFPTCKMGLVLHLNFYWHHSGWYLEQENPPSHGLGLFSWIWHSWKKTKQNRKNHAWQNVGYTFFHCATPHNKPSLFSLLLKLTSVCLHLKLWGISYNKVLKFHPKLDSIQIKVHRASNVVTWLKYWNVQKLISTTNMEVIFLLTLFFCQQ